MKDDSHPFGWGSLILFPPCTINLGASWVLSPLSIRTLQTILPYCLTHSPVNLSKEKYISSSVYFHAKWISIYLRTCSIDQCILHVRKYILQYCKGNILNFLSVILSGQGSVSMKALLEWAHRALAKKGNGAKSTL